MSDVARRQHELAKELVHELTETGVEISVPDMLDHLAICGFSLVEDLSNPAAIAYRLAIREAKGTT